MAFRAFVSNKVNANVHFCARGALAVLAIEPGSYESGRASMLTQPPVDSTISLK